MMLGFGGLTLALPLPVDRLTSPPATRVHDREGHPLRVFISSEEAFHFPVELAEVSPHVIEATIAFEDRWFRWHPGINPVSTIRALVQNIRSGRIVSGGSTITQQVARLMDPRARTIGAKLIEAFRALQLELRYSKDEILQWYLNLAPYGGNIQGIEAAALLYYGKTASALGPGEAALLSVLPNSPTRFRPDRNPELARDQRDEVLGRMLDRRKIDPEQHRRALREAVPVTRAEVPFRAPHLGDMLRNRYGSDAGDLVSTIDPATQQLAESLLNRHMLILRSRGISNGAIVVMENGSRAVRALVGSAGFFQAGNAGQVNGATASRSPGSALKPFAYGLALDGRLISPSTLLEDVPINIGGYIPKNYDGEYLGVVTAEDALMHSMNVPAVNLVYRLGADRFHTFLRRGGLSTLTEPYEHYGLSLVLGGAGVSLLDLTNLYATLASEGIYRPYRLLEDAVIEEGRRILSSESAFILTNMLSRLPRPDFPDTWEFSIHLPKIAWKTGTSYGHRDAWSIGYNPTFTIGVWLGNFSGEGSPALVGADVAGPLLFDLATALEGDAGSWFEPPVGVEEREVCALSGLLPGEHCTHLKREYHIVDISPHRTCNFHVNVAVDDETGDRLCPACWTDRPFHWETFVQWPSTIATWMRENGHPVPEIPTHNPSCRSLPGGDGPLIKSPATGVRYVLRSGVPIEDQQIRLEASVSSGIQTLYWFVDGVLLTSSHPTEPVFYLPKRGRHEVVCMDNEGRSTRVSLIVE
ncbi:penicillin-binding protein 1C [Gemmatimonadota bacterium]